MSQEPEKIQPEEGQQEPVKTPLKNLQCFDESDNYIGDIETKELPSPLSTSFSLNETKYMVVSLKTVPINEEEAKQEDAMIVDYMAVVREVESLGLTSTTFRNSKIYGPIALKLQESREKMKKLGIDTDTLEEMGHSPVELSETLDDEQLIEYAQTNGVYDPLHDIDVDQSKTLQQQATIIESQGAQIDELRAEIENLKTMIDASKPE